MGSLPDLDQLKHSFAYLIDNEAQKSRPRSWADLVLDVENDIALLEQSLIEHNSESNQEATLLDHLRFIRDSRFAKLMATNDIFSSDELSKLAEDTGVKSWQIIEYVELIRDDLCLKEEDFIRYSEVSASDPDLLRDMKAGPPKGISLNNNSNYIQAFTPAAIELKSKGKDKLNSKFGVALLVGAGSILLVLTGLSVNSYRTSHGYSSGQNNKSLLLAQAKGPGESVYFAGIKLPITDKLCNKRGSFCIFNLATVVQSERGRARYEFRDSLSGKNVFITGSIAVNKVKRSGSSRFFTFNWHDDRRKTTPGYAASGYFRLEQDKDPQKKGILTRFVTTRSYGSQTPVGLQNTSHLFPR